MNVDWVGNQYNKKSTSDGCFDIGNNLVSWHSKKKNYISFSIGSDILGSIFTWSHSHIQDTWYFLHEV